MSTHAAPTEITNLFLLEDLEDVRRTSELQCSRMSPEAEALGQQSNVGWEVRTRVAPGLTSK